MIAWLESIEWSNFWTWITVVNIIDILIVTFFIYQLIRIAKGTKATELLKGILVIILIKFVSNIFQLHTTEYIVDFIIQWSGSQRTGRPRSSRLYQKERSSHRTADSCYRKRRW